MTGAPTEDRGDLDLEVGRPQDRAAGVPALVASVRQAVTPMGPADPCPRCAF